MRHISIMAAAAFILNAAASAAAPLASGPLEVGQACSESLGDCAGTLTCIPVSTNCTRWATGWNGDEGCPGTCQNIDISQAQIYTLCGGWSLYDDCDERVERCVLDPRTSEWGCGPSCDGPGVCWPFIDMCGGETGMECPEGKACFVSESQSGMCFPLRFGSDHYEKTSLEEIYRTDQDGMQRDEKEP